MTQRWTEPFRTMVTFGESTTAGGWSSSRDRCWANLLARLIADFQDEPPRLVNTGIGGNLLTTRSPGYPYSAKPAALERLQKHVIDHAPDLLIVSYGLNDARAGTQVEVFREDLALLIKRVREACGPILIVLMGPYFMTDFSAGNPRFTFGSHERFGIFNDVTRMVAQDMGCLYCDVFNEYGGAEWLVHYDGVHANDLGHQIIANALFRILAQNCPGLGLRTKRLEKTSERWRDESMLQADYGY